MNDLRELMDRAAGEPDALSDAELQEFVQHGRKVVRRRRFAAATGAVAVTAAIATGWALLPTGPVAGPAPAGPQTSPAVPSPPAEVGGVPTVITLPPRPSKAVPLVADGIRRRNSNDKSWSSLVCGLKPKGWTVSAVRVGDYGDPTPDGPDLLQITNKKYPADAEGFDAINVRMDEFATATDGSKIMPKMLGGWDDHLHYQAGPYQAVINGSSTERVPMSASGEREINLRLGRNTLLTVTTNSPRLGWDLRTALRFAGSCRIVD